MHFGLQHLRYSSSFTSFATTAEFVSSDEMETFENGKEVILDYCNFRTACTTLPTLQEGHVIGKLNIFGTIIFWC
jgi:hypothetical protein